jgi:hypothetical protein
VRVSFDWDFEDRSADEPFREGLMICPTCHLELGIERRVVDGRYSVLDEPTGFKAEHILAVLGVAGISPGQCNLDMSEQRA